MEETRKNNSEVKLALIQQDINYIKVEVSEIKKLVGEKYVTIEMFEPVRRIVYGLVGLVLVGVMGALLALVVRQ